MKELFDEKFVHFMWDDELKGKKGFFADSVNVLKSYIKDCGNNCVGKVSVSNNDDYPFCNSCGVQYRFFYYDPNYECKKAYAEGKQIQYFDAFQNEWYDDVEPIWDDRQYRIKPEEPKSKRMTYRQFSEWLAKGNGEVTCNVVVTTTLDYNEAQSYEEVDDCYSIRRWGSDEWVEPTEQIYFEDCK